MLVRLAEPSTCVASAIRELGHDPYPWGIRDGYRHVTACRQCGATAETVEVDGETFASGAATLCLCPGGPVVRHLTLTAGVYVDRPVCGAPTAVGIAPMSATAWDPGEHGRDFCPRCMAAVEQVRAEVRA